MDRNHRREVVVTAVVDAIGALLPGPQVGLVNMQGTAHVFTVKVLGEVVVQARMVSAYVIGVCGWVIH